MTLDWSATQYVAFEEERTRPVRDLLAAVPSRDAATAIDIGCGPGNSTELLVGRFPGSTVSGLDSSYDMIAAARERLPTLRFDVDDIEAWAYRTTGQFDVILANAVLQWVPKHSALFPALAAKLAPGGALAVQMPDNLQEPAHVLMRDVAAAGPWAEKIAAAESARTSLRLAEWYFALLRQAGCRVEVWRTTYHHALAGGAAAVVDWFMGTGLRPFLAPLDTSERSDFLERYRSAMAETYPAGADGTVLLPFPRLFIVAVR